MSEIEIFNNEEFGNIRVAMNENNEPLFCLSDVCKILDLQVGATKNRLDEKGISLINTPTKGGIQQLIYISEKNLYKVIMRSDKPQAEPFQDWVCGEVLPSIRKHGIYATDDIVDQIINNPDLGIQLLTKLKEEREARKEAESRVAILTHTNKTYTCTEVAKELGMKSANELNIKLHEKGIQYKINGTWLPYTDYANLAWFDIKQECLDNGHIIYHRRITGIGREAILQMFKE